LGLIDMLLSFRITSRSLSELPALLRASKARPPVMLPSPMIATTWWSWSSRSRISAKPTAAEIEVLACPAPKWSCGLSSRLRKGLRPWYWRMVGRRSRRPVITLWM
jgi:hypothetical protein